jgi:predicted PurR-regulated permease PerM
MRQILFPRNELHNLFSGHMFRPRGIASVSFRAASGGIVSFSQLLQETPPSRMLQESDMERKQVTTTFLLVLAAVALYVCFVIARPFLSPFFLAAMIAVVFHPVQARVQARVHNQNTAATMSTILVLLVSVVPAIGLGIAVNKEIAALYQSLNENRVGEGGWNPVGMHAAERVLSWVGRYVDISSFDLRAALVRWLKEVSQPLLSWGVRAVSNAVLFITNAFITFFTLFFLFRDGCSMMERVGDLLPLSASQRDRLFNGISNSIIANVHGCFAVGIAQGLLAGLAFWALGLSSPILWGVVTALFSMVPVIGSAAVWGPAAIFLFITGHWIKGLALLCWGAAVVGQADNVIRPYVISQRASMHPLLVFFALLGGVQAFGVIGLFVGPVVLSVTIIIFQMLSEERSQGTAA